MKKNNEKHLMLLSLLANIIISFFLGFKYKNQLISMLTEAIYYQFIIFISLLMPEVLRRIYSKAVEIAVSRKVKKLQKDAPKIDKNKLDPATAEKLDKIINTDFSAKSRIHDVYDDIDEIDNKATK